jgi:catechol 2,3-dioxygenase-like lactoylglutathione lyase family enzyme
VVIDHTGVEVTDYARSKAFYDAAFGAMGGGLLHTVPEQFTDGKKVVGYGRERPCSGCMREAIPDRGGMSLSPRGRGRR